MGELCSVWFDKKCRRDLFSLFFQWHPSCAFQTFSLSLVVATLYYGAYLVTAEEMTGGELISFILYQMNLGFMFSVSTWERCRVGSSSRSSSTRWTWDSCSQWVLGRDAGWGGHLIHPLPDEPGIHVLNEYLGEMMDGELISFILYQMNLGFIFSVSTLKRWWVGSSSHTSSTRWTWDSYSWWVPWRDDGWGAHLIHPLPDEPGIHILGEYLGGVMGGELISLILYQMNLGFMLSVSTWERWWVGSSSHWSSTRWTWDSCSRWVPGRDDDGWGTHTIHPLPDELLLMVSTWERWWVGSSSHSSSTRWIWDSCSQWVPGRDDGWEAHLIHPLPDEPGIHVLGEYLGGMMGGKLI